MKSKFDSFIAIDWSGAEALYTPSIAVAEIKQDSSEIILIKSPNRALWSRMDVYEFLLKRAREGGRIFIGIDANFSYAHTVIHRQFPNIKDAFALWGEIDFICRNNNNFYAKDFWTHPDFKKYFWVSGKIPKNFTLHARETEQECKNKEIGSPENPFKLIGAKQVGKGGLSVMRMLYKLRKELKNDIAIWPFDSKDKIDSARMVCAEIYPRLFIKQSGYGQKKIRTKEDLNLILTQSNAFCDIKDKLSDHDTDALIAAAGIKHYLNQKNYFDKEFNSRITHNYEGWIFGV